MTPTEHAAGPDVLARAAAELAAKQARYRDLYARTPAERLRAFYAGELSLGQCLAWARRYPHEVPLASSGEYLFIAMHHPEWSDAPDDAQPTPRDLPRAA